MKLKRYIQFIKESVEELQSLWKLDEDDIEEYFLELTDNGYIISVDFGFVEDSKYYDYGTGKYKQKDVFTEKAVSGENVRPAYWIQVIKTTKITNEDLSDTFKFAVDIISDNANAECSVHDTDGNLGSVDGIVIKGGLFYTDDWNSSEPELLETENYISIFAKQKESVVITTKQLAKYYNWTINVEKDGKSYAEMDLEDLADFMLARRSNYKDSLVKGQEHMWDYYNPSDYIPDINSLFQYTLDNENSRLLIKAIIKELGGIDQTKNHIGDECDDEVYDAIKDKSEDEVVEFLIKERFHKTIKQIKSDSETYNEVSDIVANWESSAHCDDNYEEIVDEFDDIVKDELGAFTKITKEVPKYYTTKDSEGNDIRREYKTDVVYFQFPYTNRWIEDMDAENIKNRDLDDIFREWIAEQNFNYEMNPRLSDYGNVDSKKMNEEIKYYLTKYLNR